MQWDISWYISILFSGCLCYFQQYQIGHNTAANWTIMHRYHAEDFLTAFDIWESKSAMICYQSKHGMRWFGQACMEWPFYCKNRIDPHYHLINYSIHYHEKKNNYPNLKQAQLLYLSIVIYYENVRCHRYSRILIISELYFGTWRTQSDKRLIHSKNYFV